MGIPPGGPRPVGLRFYRFVMSDRGCKRAQYKLERSGLKIGPTLSGPHDTNTEKQVVWPPVLFGDFVGNQEKVASHADEAIFAPRGSSRAHLRHRPRGPCR